MGGSLSQGLQGNVVEKALQVKMVQPPEMQVLRDAYADISLIVVEDVKA